MGARGGYAEGGGVADEARAVTDVADDWRVALQRQIAQLRAELGAQDDPVHRLLERALSAVTDASPAGLRPALSALGDGAAALGALDRELLRRGAIERLREIGVVDPRSLVAAALGSTTNGGGGKHSDAELGGSVLALSNVEPWPEPVDGAELLDRLCDAVGRFVVVDSAGVIAVALWVLHAHAHEAAAVSPLLALTSPAKRCGKTTLLSLLGALVPRPLPAANLTAAALFRALEAFRPTLLVDEVDTFLSVREELRGLLNSGHTRPFAVVVRTVGDNHEVRRFSTWGPKALALIGSLPDTLADRSIVLRMRRRARGERIETLRLDRLYDDLTPLRRQCARWATDSLAALRAADPAVPSGLSDRAADNWRPLLAIADTCGDVWPQEVRAAALALSGEQQVPDQGAEALLLADLHALFDERGVERLPTASIIEHLVAMHERPWPEWSHGRPLSPRGLARILGRFGIGPVMFREGEVGGIRGYERRQFTDAWARYLAPPATSATSATAKSSNDLGVADVADVAGPAGDMLL